MTGLPANGYDPLYVAFLAYFNRERDYFECHEVMEQLWLEEGRNPLFQGLLQVAVGLYHHENGNLGGGVKLLTAALKKLEGCAPPEGLGIDLELLIADTRRHLSDLEQCGGTLPLFQPFDIEITDPALLEEVNAFEPDHA